jgi:hypothetical protein
MINKKKKKDRERERERESDNTKPHSFKQEGRDSIEKGGNDHTFSVGLG